MDNTIKFTTYDNPSRQGVKKGPCIGRITHNGTLGGDALAQALALKTGFSNVYQSRAFLGALAEVVSEALSSGQLVDLGVFQLGLALKGTFPATNAPFDPKTNKLEVYVKPSKTLMWTVQSLSPVNATPMNRPWLNEICCDGRGMKLNEITLGVRLVINGKLIKIDPTREDEGIWLEDKVGTKLVQAEILDTDNASAKCRFAVGSIAPGKYRLSLYTRASATTSDQPAAVYRNVTVLPAIPKPE